MRTESGKLSKESNAAPELRCSFLLQLGKFRVRFPPRGKQGRLPHVCLDENVRWRPSSAPRRRRRNLCTAVVALYRYPCVAICFCPVALYAVSTFRSTSARASRETSTCHPSSSSALRAKLQITPHLAASHDLWGRYTGRYGGGSGLRKPSLTKCASHKLTLRLLSGRLIRVRSTMH